MQKLRKILENLAIFEVEGVTYLALGVVNLTLITLEHTMWPNPTRKIFVFGIVIFCGSGLLSCEITEPEPFFNTAAKPPAVERLDLKDLPANSHVAGIVVFQVDLDSIKNELEEVSLFVDDDLIDTQRRAPFIFSLDTRNWPAGKHVIALAIVKRNAFLGLLNAVGYPERILVQEVHFNQARPTPVDPVSLVWQGEHPLLTWQQNHDANFYAYIVERRVMGMTSAISDTIRDQHTTKFHDSYFGKMIGRSLIYRVLVSNRAQNSLGRELTLGYGQRFPSDGPRDRIVKSQKRDEFYYIDSYGLLHAFSTSQQREVWNYWTQARLLDLTPNDSILYIATQHSRPDLQRIAAQSFAVLDSFEVEYTGSNLFYAIFSGNSNRLYFLSRGELLVVNGVTRQLLGHTPLHRDNSQSKFSTMSRVMQSVYIISGEGRITIVDVATDTPRVDATLDLPRRVRSAEISEDHRFVYLMEDVTPQAREKNGHIDIWDAQTRQISGSIAISLTSNSTLKSLALSSSHLYVSYQYPLELAVYPGKVAKFELATQQRISEVEFNWVPDKMAVSRDGQFLYTWGDDGHIIPTTF